MPTPDQLKALRSLPQVEELLHHHAIEVLTNVMPRSLVTDLVRNAIADARAAILDSAEARCSNDEIARAVLLQTLALEKPSLRRVVNASGVIIHTNLGRSVLADAAVHAVTEVARGYSTLEYSCSRMARGSRHDHYEQMICTLTGAEAAIAVNNNAAAVMMVLAEFASGHEAIISRGELVEIGGSFRVPDIMALSRATMIEVGTTNKTHLFDYERHITGETAMLLKVHPSNYRMTGFTESVQLKDLRRLADKVNAARGQVASTGAAAPEVLVYEDLGSGALTEIAHDGFRETTVREALEGGADLVSFSCDKLMGGPQAGVIIGKKTFIDRLKSSPYARVLRLDKMTIAALEATLRLYLDESVVRETIPTVRMLTEDAQAVKPRAEAIKAAIESALSPNDVELSIAPDISRAGGGALPMCDIPTYVVRVSFKRGQAQDCERYMIAQRDMPVVARIKDECILLDGRTVLDEGEIDEIARAFGEYFESLPD